MSYWDYEEPMWEPSEADELFDEIKSKLIDAAKDSLKSDMEHLKSRNEYLEKRNKELEDKAREVSSKESDLEYKSRNLRREVEREFYKAAIEDIFKDMIEKSQLWFAENKPHEKPKCDKCDENRNWVLTWPNGEKVTKKCDCAQPDYWYEPKEAWIDTLRYRIQNSNYQSERHYRLDKTYDRIGGEYTCPYRNSLSGYCSLTACYKGQTIVPINYEEMLIFPHTIGDITYYNKEELIKWVENQQKLNKDPNYGIGNWC